MDERPAEEPTSHSPQTPPPEPSASGPPNGFGKDVNNYLNHYVTVADAKAAVLLAVDFVVLQFLLKDYFDTVLVTQLHIAAAAFLVMSALATLLVVFPRLPRGSDGIIFWEDIRENKTPDAYYRRLTSVDKAATEQQYAHQNFYVSKVLHRKMRWTQWSVGLFALGAACAIVCVIW